MSYQHTIGWKPVGLAGDIPKARSGHSIVSKNERSCYLFGGYDGTTCFNDVYILSLDDERFPGVWRKVITDFPNDPVVPSPRASHAACNCADLGMYICGGSGEEFGHSNTNDCFFFDYDENRWYDITNAGLEKVKRLEHNTQRRLRLASVDVEHTFEHDSQPAAGYGRACTFDAESLSIWIFGGTTGRNYSNDLWRFHLPSGRWSRLARSSGQNPSPRYTAKLGMCGGTIIVVGGGIPAQCFSSDPLEVFSFNTETSVWSKAALPVELPCPGSRFAHAVAQLDPRTMFVFGGSARRRPNSFDTLGSVLGGDIRAFIDSHMYDDAWVYDIPTNTWTQVAPAENSPCSLDFVAAAPLRGGRDVVIFGGFNKVQRNNDAARLRLRNEVPSLEAVCLKGLHELRIEDPERFPSEDELEGEFPSSMIRELFHVD